MTHPPGVAKAEPGDIVRIRSLNDDFRRSARGEQIVFSLSAFAMACEFMDEIREAIAGFDAFDELGEPDGEHDFGYAEVCGHAFFWKIEYLDPDLVSASQNPCDPSKTIRKLFVVWSHEFFW